MHQLLNREDPLAPASARLSQGRGRFESTINSDSRSAPGIRPYGLRFTTASKDAGTALPAWHFDEQRQIGLDPNGDPWYQGIVDMTMKTTGPSPDGGGSTGGEEWGPDYLTDEPTI
jgi:putative ATP-grasp target RiPP